MNKAISSLLLTSALMIPTVSFAGADSGFYVGGALGQASVKAEDTGF